MSSTDQTQGSVFQRYAWLVLFALAVLMCLLALYPIFAGPDEAEFESSTEVVWSELTTAVPGVADYVSRLIRLLGAGYLGFGLLAASIAWTAYKKGERWSWYVLWAMPLTFGLAAIIFFVFEANELGLFYGAAALLAVLGLLLPLRVFFPR